jgi:Flp pilus assembly protein TadD
MLMHLPGCLLAATAGEAAVRTRMDGRAFVRTHVGMLAGGSSTSDPLWAAEEARGLVLFNEGRHSEAVDRLEASIAMRVEDDPSCVPTHVNLGIVWESLGLPISALECYNRALSLDPQSAAAYEHMGGALDTHFGERAMALDALRTAVQLAPQRATSWTRLGTVLHASGVLDEATDALARAAALEPRDAAMRANLAALQRATGRFEEAAASLREAAAHSSERMLDNVVNGALAYYAVDGETGGSEGGGEGGGGGDEKARPASAVVATVPADALPSTLPAPWRSLLRSVHSTAVADVDECAWVIREAEAHAASLGGWDGRGHHDYHPTNDVVVAACASLRAWLRSKLRHIIWPAISEQFGVTARDLWLEDAFVVRYEAAAGGQPGLESHTDDSELSFNILLSPPDAFTGGGTRFEAAANATWDGLVRPERGQMLSHYGRLRHAGHPVREGVRYILAGFVRCRPLALQWREIRGGVDDVAEPESSTVSTDEDAVARR